MAKRFRRATILEDYRAEMSGKSIDDLQEERRIVSQRFNKIKNECATERARLDTIASLIAERKGGGEIGISDHAVLRYMERHLGVDVRAVRKEISEMAAARKRVSGTGDHFDIADGIVAVIPNGGVMATVLPRPE